LESRKAGTAVGLDCVRPHLNRKTTRPPATANVGKPVMVERPGGHHRDAEA
jgi:hypothetical protein